jgi:hypothetical protein
MAVAMGRQSIQKGNARQAPLTVDIATRLGGTIIGIIAFGAALGELVGPAGVFVGAAVGAILGVAFAVVARRV